MILLLVTLLLMSMYAFWVHTGKDRVGLHQEEGVEGDQEEGVEGEQGEEEEEEQEEQEDEEFDTFLERLDDLIFQEDDFYGDDMVPGSTYIGLVGFARGNQTKKKTRKTRTKTKKLFSLVQSTACHRCRPVAGSAPDRISRIATTSCWRTSWSMRIWCGRLRMDSVCMYTDCRRRRRRHRRRHRHVQWCVCPITSPWCNGIGAAFFVVVVNAYNSDAMSPRWPSAV